jgi:hypothetical protein
MATLKQPQLFLDYLVPANREKFRLDEVAEILSPDDGRPPVSAKSIRNAMEEGRLFGNRIPFSAPIGQEQRIRVEWMTRADVQQALLRTRTASPQAQIDDISKIVATWPAEAIDELMRNLAAMRARRPIGRSA